MREKVYLAGTDDVIYIMESLEKELGELGYDVIWFHKRFPINGSDTMDNCLKNVKKSSRFILVLNKRYGLPSRNRKVSITEEEFLTAYNNEKFILIFIHQETEAHSKIYRRLKKQGINITENNKNEYGFKADIELFEFFDRIQHMEKEGKLDIKWRELFSSIRDIVKQIKLKWGTDAKNIMGKNNLGDLIKKLLKDLGADIIDQSDVDSLIDNNPEIKREIRHMALIFGIHAGRETVASQDIELAVNIYIGTKAEKLKNILLKIQIGKINEIKDDTELIK